MCLGKGKVGDGGSSPQIKLWPEAAAKAANKLTAIAVTLGWKFVYFSINFFQWR